MIVFLIIVGCILLSAAIVAGPLLLPWPAQVRWLMSARLMCADTLVADAFGSLLMSETQLVAVDPGPGTLAVVVADPRQVGCGSGTRLVGPLPGVGRVAALEGWVTTGVPLLLITEGDGRMSLHGPDASLTGLRRRDADWLAAAP